MSIKFHSCLMLGRSFENPLHNSVHVVEHNVMCAYKFFAG